MGTARYNTILFKKKKKKHVISNETPALRSYVNEIEQ
jgi:hypothetical protein